MIFKGLLLRQIKIDCFGRGESKHYKTYKLPELIKIFKLL